MIITDNQLKGNWAEQYIAAQLSSQGCLVRHVTQGHDTGIDLYCEKVKDGKPYLHFWCQVKTSKKWTGKAKSYIFRPPKKDSSRYWIDQPIPVYIFLVPDLRGKDEIPYYICRAIEFESNEKVKSKWKIKNASDLTFFLELCLPIDTFEWDLKNGKVSYLKNTQVSLIKFYPPGLTHYYEPRIKPSILNSLCLLSNDIIFREGNVEAYLCKKIFSEEETERLKRAEPYINTLMYLIDEFNDLHYHYYELIGEYNELLEDFKKAINYYHKTIEILHRDPNSSKEPWQSWIKRINRHLDRIKTKLFHKLVLVFQIRQDRLSS